MFGDENKTTEKKKYTNCLTPYGSNCKLINQKDYEIELEKIILKSLTSNKPINIIQKQKSGVKKRLYMQNKQMEQTAHTNISGHPVIRPPSVYRVIRGDTTAD